MDPLLIVALLVLGACTGFAAGLLGIGGGMIMVPFLTMLFTWKQLPPELVVHAAIATSMASILFTSISSVRAHHKRGAVRWDIVARFAPGLVVGGLLAGGAVFSFLKTGWLALAFAIFVGYSALQMLLDKKPKPSRQMPGTVGTSAAGAGIGFLSGLVGAGGGFVSVPFMTWCNVPLHNAVATSAALGFPIAAANTIGYIWSGMQQASTQPGMLGYVYWPGLLVLIVSSVLLAPVGAATAHKLPVKSLKRIFAYLLMLLAVYMLYKGVTSLGAA
ncbi:sulfite exporter TauE/SafE family protein [Pigmentiphaga sp.]|uniref:sulfite exporter TauE/SafE family protein n=1 Tax=Pigmentiphaga sp. TaxID=1977564 RepID=UPI0025CBE9ED|nr:sulfite exporter TauE/SafE family protein [Pigmentiphaga sp.]MBX6317325.1 sulfite exporter TauE/SafE family protein [Pigmentiphaga sp.]